jgi:uncharacterized protein YbjT (DUF2867 family)
MRDSAVTVIGGTGFIGRYLIRHVAATGAQVRVPSRNPDRAFFLKQLGEPGQIAPLPLDVADEASLAAVLKGADFVVNLAGILHERRSGDFERVHVQMPARIARLAPAGARIIHVSAIGADPGARSIYASTKGRGEAELRSLRPDAVILRPSVVFGPEDQFLNRFARMAVYLPFLPAVGGGRTRFQPVFVGDVARAIMSVMEHPETAGQTFELGGPEVMTFRQILEWLLKVLRRRRPIVNVPFGWAGTLAWVLQALPSPMLTRDQVLLLRSDNVVATGTKGLEELGIAPTPMSVVAPSFLQQYMRLAPGWSGP